MHNQNVNQSGDLCVDNHDQNPESEVFPNQLHSEEYTKTPQPQEYLSSSTNDTQHQSFNQEDTHSWLPDSPMERWRSESGPSPSWLGIKGAGYNGRGLSADEYKAAEASYGYQAPYTSYYHPDRSSTTPSNDDSNREGQEQDQGAEHVESYVHGNNRHSTSGKWGKSCVSFGSIVRNTHKVLNFNRSAVGLEEDVEIQLEIVKIVEDRDLIRLPREVGTLQVHRNEFWVDQFYFLWWLHCVMLT